jgi:hypothetical protein
LLRSLGKAVQRNSEPAPARGMSESPAAPVTGVPPAPVTGVRPNHAAQQALVQELTRLSSPSRNPSMNGGSASPGDKAAPMLALALELDADGVGIKRWAAARLRDAHTEELAGHLLDAANILRMIVERLSDPRLQREADRLNRALITHTAHTLRTRARSAERSGDYRGAAEQWKRIALGLTEDGEAHLQAARALLEIGQTSDAGRYAMRAAELMPEASQPREVLIRFFEATGMTLNAKRERAALKRILDAKKA